MSRNTNQGTSSFTVYGDPESFKELITNHGQLCKVKQALVCPCVSDNSGSPKIHCSICNGKGYIYTYQRRMFVSDENTPVNYKGDTLSPFWVPIDEVVSIQKVTGPIQGGIQHISVVSFTDETITINPKLNHYDSKRVSYYFDGWTHIEREKLRVDTTHKIMYADGTIYNAQYQSSNPLKAYSDIAHVVKIWDDTTGVELINYKYEGNTISTTQNISDNMYIDYYYADLSKVITTDLNNKEQNEVYIHDLKSGECKMAFYPFLEIAKGDIIVLPATVLYKNQQLVHRKDFDELYEIEIDSLHGKILDSSGNIYSINDDYILQGNAVRWVGNKPKDEVTINVRYGYKPSYIVFDDNPQPNNLENKQYPTIVLAKSWSKTTKDEVAKLRGGI